MIVSCPKCGKRYNLDDSRAGKSIKVRCTGCGSVFSTLADKDAEAPPPAGNAYRVLLATDDPDLSGIVEELLKSEGVSLIRALDGNETIDAAEKKRPHLVILDVAIPGPFSFAICEHLKKDLGLRDTRIILTSAAYNRKRYTRRPTCLFGADGYIEKHSLREELVAKMRELLPAPGPGANPAAEAAAAQKMPPLRSGGNTPPPAKAVAGKRPEAPEKPPAGVEAGVHEKAKRLARIIASDIFLYHRKKIDRDMDMGKAHEVFKAEISEGVNYFTKRIPSPVPAEDYINKALEELLLKMGKETMAGRI